MLTRYLGAGFLAAAAVYVATMTVHPSAQAGQGPVFISACVKAGSQTVRIREIVGPWVRVSDRDVVKGTGPVWLNTAVWESATEMPTLSCASGAMLP